MSWRVVWDDRAADEMRRLAWGNPTMARRVGQAIARLAETGQGDLKRLRGEPREWRLRVGDWRVRLDLDAGAQLITVLRVLPRGRAYRD